MPSDRWGKNNKNYVAMVWGGAEKCVKYVENTVDYAKISTVNNTIMVPVSPNNSEMKNIKKKHNLSSSIECTCS